MTCPLGFTGGQRASRGFDDAGVGATAWGFGAELGSIGPEPGPLGAIALSLAVMWCAALGFQAAAARSRGNLRASLGD